MLTLQEPTQQKGTPRSSPGHFRCSLPDQVRNLASHGHCGLPGVGVNRSGKSLSVAYVRCSHTCREEGGAESYRKNLSHATHRTLNTLL